MHAFALSLQVHLQWDPQIRGMLFTGLAVTMLIGSVFLLLATNVGFRMGLWMTATGLIGLLMIMTGVWTVYALKQGPPNPSTAEATWVAKEVITGDLKSQTGNDALVGFSERSKNNPNGWEKLPIEAKEYADAVARTDNTLAPAPPVATEHGAPKPVEPTFVGTSPFSNTTDYQVVGAYQKGGETYWPLNIGVRSANDLRNKGTEPNGGEVHWWTRAYWRATKGFLHKPHYAIVQVQPVKAVDATDIPYGTAPPAPVVDESAPVTTIIMERKLGTARIWPFRFFVLDVALFSLLAYGLHKRDKRLMALKTAQAATA